MLKPSLQLKLGQQLTMTPQLQQAIRLLQLPALELQAHIRELLETNVMLEPDEAEASGTFEVAVTAAEQPKPPERAAESTVEVLEEGWGDHSVGPAETPWSGDEDERQQEYADESGKSLQDHLMWQLELAGLAPRELAVARAIVDAISDDGYLDRKSTRLNSSHLVISYAVFCLKKKKTYIMKTPRPRSLTVVWQCANASSRDGPASKHGVSSGIDLRVLQLGVFPKPVVGSVARL